MPKWWVSSPLAAELVIATAGGEPVGRVPGDVRVQMQYLCTRMDIHEGGIPRSLAITSSTSGEGVTFVSRALAATLSEDLGRRTCLVGANWWDDDQGGNLAGLAEVVRDGWALADVLISTRSDRLHLLEPGNVERHQRARLATSNSLDPVLRALEAEFDHVLIDLPALSTSAAALTFAAAADATLLVARQRMTRVDQVERAVADLRHTRLLGVVLNDHELAIPVALQQRLLEV